MSNMKHLLESIEEAERLLSRNPPFGDEELGSLFHSLHRVACHGNAGLRALAERLSPEDDALRSRLLA
jgi:hypothetical protein